MALPFRTEIIQANDLQILTASTEKPSGSGPAEPSPRRLTPAEHDAGIVEHARDAGVPARDRAGLPRHADVVGCGFRGSAGDWNPRLRVEHPAAALAAAAGHRLCRCDPRDAAARAALFPVFRS